MTHLELSEAEVEALGEVFETYLSDLRMEIVATDRAEFREGLKTRKELILSMLERMKAGHA
ncbi:MAG TPA: hypothetical protein VK997_01140 [Deferrisomatales bacterium]|nr:hypothetical protein [Deferrisomatales bacterium]